MTTDPKGCIAHDCADCKKRDAEIERLRGHIKHIGNDALRAENQILLKGMRYIAGISTGQVKRVADAALASLAQPAEHYEEQPDGTVIPVDPSEIAQPANTGLNPIWVATHPDNLQPPAEPVELSYITQELLRECLDALDLSQALLEKSMHHGKILAAERKLRAVLAAKGKQ